MDCIVHVVTKSRTQLNDFHFHFLVAQRVKNPPEMKDTQVLSLGQEDPLEKAMATHSSVLAWRMPWTKEPGGLQSMEWQRVRHN